LSGLRIGETIASLRGLNVRSGSVVSAGGAEFGVGRAEDREQLVVLAPKGSLLFKSFTGEVSRTGQDSLLVGPANARNLKALRAVFPWLRPRLLGLRTSAGFGDRLGLATPGHVRALRATGGEVAPIFAQQSIREMERTGRSAQEVMDDAVWGAFSEGWRDGYGADADHLKTFGDVDACVAAGYTFFTFDPGEHVEDRVESMETSGLRTALEELPWEELESSAEDLRKRYPNERLEVEGHEIEMDEAALSRAAVKYGRAVAHVARMYRYLEQVAGDCPFEVEVSVDETESPTTHAQHVYIAEELRRLGVRWVSLAPRYIGRFEKGADYLGDVEEFEQDFAVHAAIARRFGPYKLSLHSGSDKFSIYPAAARQTQGLVHLKTAGTSYLEALRTIAVLAPELFREVYLLSRERYETDRASYHVSASLEDAPPPGDVDDRRLPALLEHFGARQVLHVTFGSVLKDRGLQDLLVGLLRAHPEAYANNLEVHFVRHLKPFAREARA
jgi:hypothetical protein